MASENGARTVRITAGQERFFSWTTDVLVYTLVLNLFVEYLDAVIIDSFTISVFTAVLLKILLDIVLGAEHKVTHFFEKREGAVYKVLGKVALAATLFVGKLFILEAVNLVFGDHVELGHFIEVVALILALMITREVFQRIYIALGESEEDAIIQSE